MKSKIQKIESGVGVVLIEACVRAVGLRVGDTVDMHAKGGAIFIEAAKRPGRLDELLEAYKPEHRHEWADFGPDVGREIVEW